MAKYRILVGPESQTAVRLLADAIERLSKQRPELQWFVIVLSCIALTEYGDEPDPMKVEATTRAGHIVPIEAADLAKLLRRLREAYDETCLVARLSPTPPVRGERDLWRVCEVVMEYGKGWEIDVSDDTELEILTSIFPASTVRALEL